MSLRNAVLRHIEELERSVIVQEQVDSVRRLRSILEKSLPYLSPAPLSWEEDANDPDVRNAADRVLRRVWQVEEVEDVTVIRVFSSRRVLLHKEITRDRDLVNDRIERARAEVYAGDVSLAEALTVKDPDAHEDPDPFDEGPLRLTPDLLVRSKRDEDAEVEIEEVTIQG